MLYIRVGWQRVIVRHCTQIESPLHVVHQGGVAEDDCPPLYTDRIPTSCCTSGWGGRGLYTDCPGWGGHCTQIESPLHVVHQGGVAEGGCPPLYTDRIPISCCTSEWGGRG